MNSLLQRRETNQRPLYKSMRELYKLYNIYLTVKHTVDIKQYLYSVSDFLLIRKAGNAIPYKSSHAY